jgi:hypothetical protein
VGVQVDEELVDAEQVPQDRAAREPVDAFDAGAGRLE